MLEAYEAHAERGGAHSENEPDALDLAPTAQPAQQALPGLPQKPTPILRLLPGVDTDGKPIDPEEKIAWWEYEGETVRADAGAQAAIHGVTDPGGKSALLRSTAVRYFRRYLAGERRFRGVAEARALEEAAEAYFAEEPDPADLPGGDKPSQRLRHVEV